jgi:hypothetical protein
MDVHQMNPNIGNLWIVSPPRTGRFAFDQPGIKAPTTMAREYRISAIGRYLISPAALNIQKRLVGCEIHWHPSMLGRWKQRLFRLIGKKAITQSPPQSLIMDFPRRAVSPTDANLKRHIHQLYDRFRPFDSFHQNLEKVDPGQVAKVTGICEDDAGYRSPVAIDGKPVEQLDFIRKHVDRQIDVRLKRAHVADGLFEMKGFDFVNFDPHAQYRLISFVYDGIPKACVIEDDHTIAFWLDDVKLVNYLQLFEYCIQQDHHMRESLVNCIQGKAAALRLMFNRRLEIDYSRAPLPAVFQQAIGQNHLADHSDRLIKQNLNLYQVGVSFNAMSLQASGRSEPCTHISILQNLRALEPIKDRLPTLFAEMAKRSAQSEEGKYYLLETISGASNES